MHKLFPTLMVLGLLVAPSAYGFFEVLDRLEQELEAEETSTLQLDDLITELEETQGTTQSFADVSASAWYHSAVSAVARQGIVSGYRDANGKLTGKFGPGNSVTIAEMLKMAYGAAGRMVAACRRPASLPQATNHWAKQYIRCAEEDDMRVIGKKPNVNRGATRAEVLAIIHDAYGIQVSVEGSSFSDTRNHTYEADIAFAASRGVVSGDTNISGMPTGTFRPDDGVNRAEAAKILFEMLKL